MKRKHLLSKSLALLVSMSFAIAAAAQKAGGTLKLLQRDSPASGSLQEEGSNLVIAAFASVFNHLVAYDQKDRMARPETKDVWPDK